MMYHVRLIERPPPDATIHYYENFGHKQSFANANFCGTFGYDLVHSDKPAQVTCRRCQMKLANIVSKERA
jgi:hypothetical protein